MAAVVHVLRIAAPPVGPIPATREVLPTPPPPYPPVDQPAVSLWNVGFVARFVIASTPPTPCPAQPPVAGVLAAELILYEVGPAVAVRQ
ncbi:hypothetical protein D3C85_1007400 [compost metagenome]